MSQERLRRGVQGPNQGWPAYAPMYPMGDPTIGVRDKIFVSKNFWNLDADHGWVTGNPVEPLTRALILAGAVRVDDADFRALDSNSGLLRPPVGRDFLARSLPGRKARDWA